MYSGNKIEWYVGEWGYLLASLRLCCRVDGDVDAEVEAGVTMVILVVGQSDLSSASLFDGLRLQLPLSTPPLALATPFHHSN